MKGCLQTNHGEVHCYTKFNLRQFLVNTCTLHKHALPLFFDVVSTQNYIVYQQIMTTMLSQNCWNIAVTVVRLYPRTKCGEC